MKNFIITLFVFIITTICNAQNITGIGTGNIMMENILLKLSCHIR